MNHKAIEILKANKCYPETMQELHGTLEGTFLDRVLKSMEEFAASGVSTSPVSDDFQPLLVKMMEESTSLLLHHKPQLSATDRAQVQVITMDCFFKHVAPHIQSKEDLEAFITQYNKVKPCVL